MLIVMLLGSGFGYGIAGDKSGSTLVGPNHPGFGSFPGFPKQGPLRGHARVRFDPIGSPGVPGFEPHGFIRNPPRSSPHPDLLHHPSGSDFNF